MHDPIRRSRRKSLQALVELARAEHGQHHELVEIGSAALNADLPADTGLAAVAAHHIIGLQGRASPVAVLDDGDPCAVVVLLDRFRRPAEGALDVRELRHSRAQHLLGPVLGQPLVVLKIVGIDDLSQRRRVPVLAGQAPVRHHSVHRIFWRQDARCSQPVGDAPEMEMLHRALGQVLPLRDGWRLDPALDESARYAAQPEVDGQRHADRASAHDDHLMPSLHSTYPLTGPRRSDILPMRPRFVAGGEWNSLDCSGRELIAVVAAIGRLAARAARAGAARRLSAQSAAA